MNRDGKNASPQSDHDAQITDHKYYEDIRGELSATHNN